ncbi:MAG TPA: FtsQ-type POTRA domain-containing protein [Pyrinomonadaceae bacterium]|nr:FtsQ-type POTRA domain-containing protein [Pyrinomonadaceae bacterium]
MKEQVIAARGSRRAATQSKGFVQKPARRDGSSSSRARGFFSKEIFAYVPWALKFVVAIVILVGLIVGYRLAAAAALFQVQTIDVSGTSRTSAEEIQGLTRRALSRSGVWRADLTGLSNELGRLPGVRRAVVTRVLPDRIRVRITERVPTAVVRTSSGHFVWVDDDGVMLGEMRPDDHMPAFFIRGWNEEGSDDARRENAGRVQKYQELLKAWDAAGLSPRVSEVTLSDLRDVRAQLAGADSQIEVRLGAEDLSTRLQIALQALDTYKQTPRGSSITYVDLQTGRVVIGFSSGSKSTADAAAANATSQLSDSSAPSPGVSGDAGRRDSDPAKPKTGEDRKKKPAPQSVGNALRLR